MIGEDKLLMTIQLTDLDDEEKNKRLGCFDTSVDPANIYPLFH